ncbi:hypothetical protein AJ80_05393 [Polytolypa hystricis UAMH7299]|uniref:Uncharacterized protein n=1 Tax=Polytolypa hystricis (strain UAMH7299) TaxID=1447883 RepID=A0A2B7Y4U2_POLH7|nr:hypothetical protein AJ80_05393 [Polytolypa hystricis UAMH7299]
MGRRPYMNLLALGRSPYEAPETPPEDSVVSQTNALESINADGYVQEYDARGHPINPESKALAKQLRRAKNDILSTMGIVVSGEDGSLRVSKERQRLNQLAAENDWGLALATLDQVAMCVSSWWATSLSSRFQTFGRYTHMHLMDVLRIERRRAGFFGFYFGGVPAWAASFLLTICRSHFLEPGLNQVCHMTVLFLIVGQTYMFSVLQLLHIVPPFSIPTLSALIPFGQTSLIQMPPLPSHISAINIIKFGLDILTSPFAMVYLYVSLRPIIEGRIYRIFRRRLPKPDRADSLSVRVALENDLIEWTVPSLGRRSEEEICRSHLSLAEELKYELKLLRNWVWGLFGRRDKNLQTDDASYVSNEYAPNLDHYDEFNEPHGVGPVNEHETGDDELATQPAQTRGERRPSGGARPSIPHRNIMETSEDQIESGLVFSNADEARLVEEFYENQRERLLAEPGADYIPRRPSSDQAFRHEEDIEGPSRLPPSRSNTLFSQPSSPQSSAPRSPRVRASLVHQNSDLITMQLELLPSSRSQASQDQNRNNNNNSNVAPDSTSTAQETDQDNAEINRRASELLDNLLGTSGQEPDASRNHEHGIENDANEVETGDYFGTEFPPPPDISGIAGDRRASSTPAPDVETNGVPPHEQPDPHAHTRSDTENDTRSMHPLSSRSRHRSALERSLPDHRVTILSSHPVDALSSHLASLVTSTLFFPLESLYLRNLAAQFLSPRYMAAAVPLGVTAATLGLRSDVRGLGPWFGGGGRADVLAYMGKMALMLGMEAMVSTCVWGIGTAVTILIGKKHFGWGNL